MSLMRRNYRGELDARSFRLSIKSLIIHLVLGWSKITQMGVRNNKVVCDIYSDFRHELHMKGYSTFIPENAKWMNVYMSIHGIRYKL